MLAFAVDAAVINGVALLVGVVVGLGLSLFDIPDGTRNVLLAVGAALTLVWSMSYFVVFWSANGQTPGNRLMQIRVQDARTGRPPTHRRALRRVLLLGISALLLFIPTLLVLVDSRRRPCTIVWPARSSSTHQPAFSARVRARRATLGSTRTISPGAVARKAPDVANPRAVIPLLLAAQGLARALGAVWRDPETRALPFVAGALVLTGTLFYWRFEDWTIIQSFYFCFVTLTTVGYGDLTPNTAGTQIFTIVYILTGFGVLVALLTSVAEKYVEQKAEPGRARARLSARRQSDAPAEED